MIEFISEQGFEPTYETKFASGCDLKAKLTFPTGIKSGDRLLVPTGVRLDTRRSERGYSVLVMPRSGMAVKNGVTVLNTPGLVDPDYEGEIQVCLINHGKEEYIVQPMQRIAQLLIVRNEVAYYGTVFAGADRGEGGFGSTGK